MVHDAPNQPDRAIRFPENRKGRRSKADQEHHDRFLSELADRIREIDSTLDFKVSSRGWCYILEEYGLLKGAFNKAQRIINDLRKSGCLPLSITVEDESRVATGMPPVDSRTPSEFAEDKVDALDDAASYYDPLHPAEYQAPMSRSWSRKSTWSGCSSLSQPDGARLSPTSADGPTCIPEPPS